MISYLIIISDLDHFLSLKIMATNEKWGTRRIEGETSTYSENVLINDFKQKTSFKINIPILYEWHEQIVMMIDRAVL